MAKRLAVYTSSLIVLVSIMGCLRPKPATATAQEISPSVSETAPPVTDNLKPDEGAPPLTQPDAAATAPAEPDKAEPEANEPPTAQAIPARGPGGLVTDDPNDATPAESPPRQIEPNNLDPGPIEPNEGTPVVPEPNQAEPNDLKPAKVEPDKVDANNIEPVKIEPNDVDANNIEPIKMAPAIPARGPGGLETEPNDPNARSAVSFHNKCAGILKTYVNGNGMVDYKTLSRKRLELKSLFDDFDQLDPNEYEKWSKEDKIALWINAYNIQMLDIIARNYPVKPISRFHSVLWGPNSVRHIEGKWTRYKFLVMDEVFTLSQIEQRFFREEFQEPRVFLALTRASLSSPPLRNEPYYGYKLYKQLDDQVRKFLANPLAFSIDKEKGKVYLSALFQKTVYGGQFVGKYGTDKKFKQKETETAAVLNFISNYVSEEVKSYLELGNYTVQFIGYNWTINDGSQ
jgi:hypothetical protein